MSASFYHITLFCLISLTLLQGCMGLTCYECKGCNSVDTNTPNKTVSNNQNYSCKKTITLAAGALVKTDREVVLNCAETDAVVAGNGYRATCCRTDLCNGAFGFSSSLIIVFSLVVAAVTFQL